MCKSHRVARFSRRTLSRGGGGPRPNPARGGDPLPAGPRAPGGRHRRGAHRGREHDALPHQAHPQQAGRTLAQGAARARGGLQVTKGEGARTPRLPGDGPHDFNYHITCLPERHFAHVWVSTGICRPLAEHAGIGCNPFHRLSVVTHGCNRVAFFGRRS